MTVELLEQETQTTRKQPNKLVEAVGTFATICFMLMMGSNGFGFVLVFVLAALKSFHIINWSNIWIAAPLWIPFALSCLVLLLLGIGWGVASLIDMARKPVTRSDKNGEQVVRTLHWWDWVWMYSPGVLILSFGLLPAAVGFGAAFVNGRIFRSGIPTFFKYLTTACITSVVFIAYCVFALMMTHGAQAAAQVSELSGDYKAAVANYTKAIKEEKNKSFAYLHRGHSLLQLENYKDALADLDEAIRLDPNEELGYKWRAKVRKKLGDIDGAKSDLDKARALDG